MSRSSIPQQQCRFLGNKLNVPLKVLPRHVAENLKLTPAEKYVEKLAGWDLYRTLTQHGGNALIAGLDTGIGRAVAVQISDPSYPEKLQADLQRLRRQLGITGPDWEQSDPQYQACCLHAKAAALSPTDCCPRILTPLIHSRLAVLLQGAAAGLCSVMLRNTEVKVERHVSFLASLQEDRSAEVQSGHNTGLLRDRCALCLCLLASYFMPTCCPPAHLSASAHLPATACTCLQACHAPAHLPAPACRPATHLLTCLHMPHNAHPGCVLCFLNIGSGIVCARSAT